MIDRIQALIVDDDEQFSFLIETYLSMLDISSCIAEDGIMALQLLEEKKFDFIITDFKMPRMNGLELLKKIKSTPKLSATKVIFVTGGGVKVDDIHQAEDLADQYILKPFTLETLQEKILLLELN